MVDQQPPIPGRDCHITSLVVRARPERVDPIASQIAAMPGMEVHATDPAGKLVVVLETASLREVTDRIGDLNAIDGVVTATLVYHQTEDAADLDEPITDPVPPDGR